MAKKQVGKKMAFKDRKIGLVIFGIIHIIIGIFCALGIPLTIFSMMAASMFDTSAAPLMNIGQMILAILLYLLLAVWFVWMGIGSILARKWARALILITSWLWFISGIGGFVFILLFIPDVYGSMAMRETIPQEMVIIVQSMVTAFMAFILVVIPGVFVLFYSSRHVKATCEQRDPQVRWTDKVPLSVITVSSLLGVIAISMPFLGFYQWAIPFFGFILSGIPGAVVVFIYTVLFAYAAWGTYKLRMRAWWCGFVLIVTSAVSMGVTFSRVSLLKFYEQMNLPNESLAMIKEFGMFQNSTIDVLLCETGYVGFLGFLVYTKRYFTSNK